MSEFRDKVILITGAGRGIGRAVASAFAEREAIIAANDITPINLDETIKRITSSSGRAKDYVFDVAKRMPVAALVNQVTNDWGRIDVLINNASVEPRASILEMDEWDWRRTIDVNLSAPFFTLQSVGRVMHEQGGGVIINIASTTGRTHVLEDRCAYIASKTGLIGLTHTAACEFAPYKIRVNAVCPRTHQTGTQLSQYQGGQASVKSSAEFASGNSDEAVDVTDLILFLCSEAASHITGQVILVDGGKKLRD